MVFFKVDWGFVGGGGGGEGVFWAGFVLGAFFVVVSFFFLCVRRVWSGFCFK